MALISRQLSQQYGSDISQWPENIRKRFERAVRKSSDEYGDNGDPSFLQMVKSTLNNAKEDLKSIINQDGFNNKIKGAKNVISKHIGIGNTNSDISNPPQTNNNNPPEKKNNKSDNTNPSRFSKATNWIKNNKLKTGLGVAAIDGRYICL